MPVPTLSQPMAADKSNLRVLIAEDDVNIAMALRSIVARNFGDVSIEVVRDGSQAVALLTDRRFDLVLSDWNMPGITGKELLGFMRSTPALAGTPFLMVTARTDRESVMQAVDQGVTDYITKPFRLGTVIDKIRELLSRATA